MTCLSRTTFITIIIVVLVVIVVVEVLFYYFLMKPKNATVSQACASHITLDTSDKSWKPVSDVVLEEGAFGFSSNNCGVVSYDGLFTTKFLVTLSVQARGIDFTDERVEFGLFRGCEACPVKEISTPAYNHINLLEPEKGNSISNLVCVNKSDKFVVKARYTDTAPRTEKLVVHIVNLKLVFHS